MHVVTALGLGEEVGRVAPLVEVEVLPEAPLVELEDGGLVLPERV
jgi:hypothetical protein